MKKIITLLLVVSIFMLFSATSPDAATMKISEKSSGVKDHKDKDTVDRELVDVLRYEVETFVKINCNGCEVAKGYEVLYYFDGEKEALLFSLVDKGYIIINLKDFSIPEFSLEGDYPKLYEKNKLIYNGPIQYFEIDKDGNVLSTIDKALVDVSSKEYKNIDVYNKAAITNDFNEVSMKYTTIEPQTFSMASASVVSGDVCSYTLRSLGRQGYLCGVDVCAILLMYYDDNYDDSMVPYFYEPYISNSTDTTLHDALINGNYIKNAPTYVNHIDSCLDSWIRGYSYNYTGVNNRFFFNYDTYKNNISHNHPTIIGTLQSPIYNNHWLVGYGWHDIFRNGVQKYLIVNDTLANGNGVRVLLEDLNATSMRWMND